VLLFAVLTVADCGMLWCLNLCCRRTGIKADVDTAWCSAAGMGKLLGRMAAT